MTSEGVTLSSFSVEQLGLGDHPAWLYSALLMAVIVGGMRTTRRGVLQLLQVCAGELWGKLCGLSPNSYLAALLGKPMFAQLRRRARAVHRYVLKLLLGRKKAAPSGGRRPSTRAGKHSLKHSKKHLNNTVSTSRISATRFFWWPAFSGQRLLSSLCSDARPCRTEIGSAVFTPCVCVCVCVCVERERERERERDRERERESGRARVCHWTERKYQRTYSPVLFPGASLKVLFPVLLLSVMLALHLHLA